MVWISDGAERTRQGQEHQCNRRLLRALSKQATLSVGRVRIDRRFWKSGQGVILLRANACQCKHGSTRVS